MNNDTRKAALKRLDAFIGTWRLEASFAHATGADDGAALSVFEWMLDGQFLVQRTTSLHLAPDSVSIVSHDPDGKTFSQHYFDSRGVVRVYSMSFTDGVWTLLRDSPDFSPLDFWQRFIGTFSAAGDSIVGLWETSSDGSSWAHDFDLTYSKVE